jgi:hypothetical protein
MTNSIFVDWTAGRSPGLCPLSIALHGDRQVDRSTTANVAAHQSAGFCARVARATRRQRCRRSVRPQVPEDYQFSALTASACCIAMRPHQRWQLWVRLGRCWQAPRTLAAGQMTPRILNVASAAARTVGPCQNRTLAWGCGRGMHRTCRGGRHLHVTPQSFCTFSASAASSAM